MKRLVVSGLFVGSALGCLAAPPGTPSAHATSDGPSESDAGAVLGSDPDSFEVEKWTEDEARRVADGRCNGAPSDFLGSRKVTRTEGEVCKDGMLAGALNKLQTTPSNGNKKVCTAGSTANLTLYRFRCRKTGADAGA